MEKQTLLKNTSAVAITVIIKQKLYLTFKPLIDRRRAGFKSVDEYHRKHSCRYCMDQVSAELSFLIQVMSKEYINHRLIHNFRVEVEPNGSFIHSCLQGELVYCQIVSELYITFSNELKVLLGIVYIRMISPWMYE